MLTTSQRIALRFTLTIALIVLFLGIVINIAFFGSRRQREQRRFDMRAGPPGMPLPGPEEMVRQRMQRKFADRQDVDFGPRNILLLDTTSEEVTELYAHTLYKNLAHFEDERYLYRPTPAGEKLIIVDISTIMKNQIELLWITLGAVLLSSIAGYRIALSTVKRGLRDLHTLAEKVKLIDLDSLQKAFAFDHLPPDDEIQIVSRALQTMTSRLHAQVATIKQFVANVSHEFKTPLMSLQSTIEVGEKTQQYDTLFHSVHEHVGVMQRLLDTLTMLTRLQITTGWESQPVNVYGVVERLLGAIRPTYPEVKFISHIDETLSLTTHQGSLERIVANLLDNAGKFTRAGGQVMITADDSGLTITDTGSGILPDALQHIWEPFRQGDQARGSTGFGLGLTLVRQLVDLLGRTITVQSTLGVGTTVMISRDEALSN